MRDWSRSSRASQGSVSNAGAKNGENGQVVIIMVAVIIYQLNQHQCHHNDDHGGNDYIDLDLSTS